MMQQGDVLLFQTPDGGEITVENGLVQLSGGLGQTAYLSMFGGNADDDGRKGNPLNWWGNLIETNANRRYRSETQYLLQKLPPIPVNLTRLAQAAKRDLAWMVSAGVASSISVSATMPGFNRVAFTIDIDGAPLAFVENWKADAA